MLKVSVRRKLKRLIADEAGTVALEYGMITSVLAVALIAGLSQVGNNLGTSFGAAANAVLSARAPTTPPPAAAPPTAAPTTVAPSGKRGGR